jgi:nicotinamidase-related amidase
MPIKSEDLHGNVPDAAGAALLLIDVINDFEFDGGDSLLELAMPVGRNIAELKRLSKQLGIPAIYVNDNFGKWQSDLNKIVSHCLDDGVRGEPFVRLLPPEADDYFVLKPKHSGFYCTSLELLLEHLGARILILAGIAGNNCVLFTANDAYMRDFKLVVPSDCSASLTSEDNDNALQQLEKVLKAEIRPSRELNLKALQAGESKSADSRSRTSIHESTRK